jgi:tyrosine-protein kinase Etk/Wzc
METLLKYLKIIVKYRRMICYSVIILTLIAAVVSFIIPKKYKSVAQILPPTEETDLLGFSSMLSSGLSSSNISRLARVGGLFKSATPSDLIAVIVESRTIGEQVINECNIMKEYRIKKSLEKALKLLKSITKVKVTDEGVVQITVLAKKPVLAANIANTYVNLTDKFLKESNMSRGHNMRVFVEKRLATAASDLKQASDSLKTFQERNKVVSLDDETKAIIDAYAQLKSELLKREIELSVSEDISTQNNPYVLSIKREIDEFKKQLYEIENGKNKKNNGFGVGFAVSFEKLPAVAAEYARRLSDYKVQFEIYGLLVQQYEQAKILEARDTPTITVLDYGKIPEKKIFPKRIAIIFIVFVASTITGILAAIVNEYFENLKQNKTTEYQSWQSIYSQIKRIKISDFFHNILPRKKVD